jgi:hypothetical protein
MYPNQCPCWKEGLTDREINEIEMHVLLARASAKDTHIPAVVHDKEQAQTELRNLGYPT